MSGQYFREKTVGIDTATLAGIDIRTLIVSMNIYEDVFAHFTTIELTVLDPLSMNEDPGIFSEEDIVISFESTSGFPTYSKSFKVYKIDSFSSSSQGSKHKVYTVHGITAGAFTNVKNRASRCWKDMKESDIVSDICTNVLGIEVETEGTLNDRYFVAPNIRPVSVIQEMCRSAVRETGYPTCNYVFYEDKNGHKFQSIDKLIEQGPSHKVTHRVAADKSHEEYAQLNARSYSNISMFDFFKNVDAGVYGTRFFWLDYQKKEYDKKDYIYSAEFGGQAQIDGGNDELMNGPPGFPEQRIILGSRNQEAEPPEFSTHFADEYRHKRQSIMSQFENNVYLVDTDGDTNVELGQIVELDMPSYDSSDDKGGAFVQKEDKRYSGNYLVAQIRHHVNQEEHRMTLGLIKHQLKSG